MKQESDACRAALAKLCEAYSALILGKLPKEVLERRQVTVTLETAASGRGWTLSVEVDHIEDSTLTSFVAANLACLMETARYLSDNPEPGAGGGT